MNNFNPLIHSFPYLLRGAGMTVLMATTSVVPATILGVLLALLQVCGLPLTGVDLPPFWGVVLVITFYYAAFMSEVFRAGILSLPQAQWDAARSLGMTRPLLLQIVILPQALRLAAPPYVSLCVSLVKATSLVSIVGLWELTMASREVVERTLAPFQVFIGAGAIYFCICYTLALYGRHLERRVIHGH